MFDIDYLQLIPSVISTVLTLVFIFFYFRFKSIKFAFGMNYYIVILTINFLMSIWEGLLSFSVLSKNTYFCMIKDLVFHYLSLSQIVWIGFYYLYLYKVVFLEEDKNKFKLIKTRIFVVILPSIEPIVDFIFRKSQSAVYRCIIYHGNINYGLIGLILVLFMLLWCFFAARRVFKKLKTHYGERKKNMKWIAFRLIFMPFITFVCYFLYMFFRGPILNHIKVSDLVLRLITSNFCFLGFYNFVALIINPEFKDSITLEKKLSAQNLIVKCKLKSFNTKT